MCLQFLQDVPVQLLQIYEVIKLVFFTCARINVIFKDHVSASVYLKKIVSGL